jgi:hypothetical protein
VWRVKARGIDRWSTPFRSALRPHSVMRLGRKALLRRWVDIPLGKLTQ